MVDTGEFSIVDENKLCDNLGRVVAMANHIFNIGHGEFLLEDEYENQKIFGGRKQVLEVNLPDGIVIVPWTIRLPTPSLGYGCYLVQNRTNSNRQGIATHDELLLPCEYGIDRHFNESNFHKENPSLLVVRKGKSEYVDGIFDLKQRQFVLPCEYHVHEYKAGLLCITNPRKGYKCGVFDVKSMKIVVPTIYDAMKLDDNRVCKCVTHKKTIWSRKRKENEIEIQL